jgi:hypothetical protein
MSSGGGNAVVVLVAEVSRVGGIQYPLPDGSVHSTSPGLKTG